MEKLLIKELQTQNPEFGYNISDGGSTTKFSEEGLKKLSNKKRGILNPNYGKHLSQDQKEFLSKKFSGKNNPNFGRKHTEEERKKMSEVNIGRKLSDEHKQKISQSLIGVFVGRPRPNGSGRSPKKVLCVETGEVFDSIAEASRSKGLYRIKTRISKVCKGEAKQCGGYHWQYYESSVS